jgi:hypothetical protein
MRLFLAIVLLASPAMGQTLQSITNDVHQGAASIPVTFVNGIGTSSTNVAMGVATGCATNTYCLSLPLADASTSKTVLSNNLIYVAVMYASTGTTPTVKLGASTMTGLSVSGIQSSKKVADYFIATATAGAPQITVASSAVRIFSIVVAQFAGVSGLDGAVKGTSNNTANNTLTGPSLTPLAGDLMVVIGCLAGTPARTSFTAGTGTNITFTNVIADIGDGCALEYGVQGTSATYSPTYTTAGTASTYITNAAAFTASTSTGTLPVGMYVAAATEVQKPLTATQVAAGTANYQFPSTGNLLVLVQSCGNFGVSSISDTNNSGWVTTWPGLTTNTNGSIAYRSNAAADSSGLITVTYQSPSAANGDCDGFFFDVHGADTVPQANRMQLMGNQTVAGNQNYISGYLPGTGSGLQFFESSDQADTASGTASPSGAVFMTATYGGQVQDGPSLPGQNNIQAIGPFSSNSSTTWTGTFSGVDAIGLYASEVMSFRASGASLGIFGNQYLNTHTAVTTGACSASTPCLQQAITPRTTAGVLWAFVAWDDATHTMVCTDGTNGTWNAVDSPVGATIGATAMRFQTFWVLNTTASAITAQCKESSGGTLTTDTAWMAVHEILGVTTIDAHPAVAHGTASASGNTLGGFDATCSATGTLSTANEYIAVGVVVGSADRNANLSFTNQQTYSAGAKGDSSGDLVVNATTTFTPVINAETGSDTFACAVTTFK